MVDLMIKVKFADASFDPDFIKNMFGMLLVC